MRVAGNGRKLNQGILLRQTSMKKIIRMWNAQKDVKMEDESAFSK